MKLTGQVAVDDTPVDVEAVLAEVEDVRLEEEARQRYLQSAE